jgi:hypothetical protein
MPRPNITRLDLLVTDVLAICNGVPQGTVVNALRRAARTLCDRSEAWVHELDPVNLVVDTVEYTISTEWAAFIKRIAEVRTRTASQVTDGESGTLIPGGLYTFVTPDTLVLDDTLSPGTAVTDGLVVTAILVPKFGSDEMPDHLFERWAQGLLGHAVYTLKIMPNVGWSDPQGAGEYLREFNECLNQAKGDVARNYCTGEGLSA